LQIEIEVAIRCGMPLLVVKPLARVLLAANALQNSPRLTECAGIPCGASELVSARERSPIEKHFSRGILAKQIAGHFEHHAGAEFVLLSRVLDIRGIEEGSADAVFVDDRPAEFGRQSAAQRALAGTGKPGHEDQHGLRITQGTQCYLDARTAPSDRVSQGSVIQGFDSKALDLAKFFLRHPEFSVH